MLFISESTLKLALALAEDPKANPTLVAAFAAELSSTVAQAGAPLPDDLLARVKALEHRNSHDPVAEAGLPPSPTSHVTDGIAS